MYDIKEDNPLLQVGNLNLIVVYFLVFIDWLQHILKLNKNQPEANL